MKRRKFIQNTLAASIGASALGSLSAHAFGPKLFPNELTNSPFFKLSLAQWSLHKAIWEKTLNPYDFAAKAKELGFEGIEYVNQLYKDVTEAKDKNAALKHFIAKSNNAANTHEVQNVLIMIDGEGDLAVPGMSQRKKAIEKHKTWIEVAAAMGCHSIRINLFGEREEQAWKAQAGDSMRQLGEYAAPYNINVIVENHGYLSSNAKLVMEMLDEVNLANCGTLPDFGNFCLEKSAGERWGAKCLKEYDRYQGVEELLPRAFAVSAKANDFDAQGNETHTDYGRMLQLVKNAGYNGFIGVEYEGSTLSEIEGILATKNLLLEKAKNIV